MEIYLRAKQVEKHFNFSKHILINHQTNIPPVSHTSFNSCGSTYSTGSSLMMSWAPCTQEKKSLRGQISQNISQKSWFHHFEATECLVVWYLRDVSGSSETKRQGANGFGHELHGNLIPTVPHCLDGLADIPVVMSHANVL